LLAGTGLALVRERDRVRLDGDEAAQRRLLSRLAQDEMESGIFSPEAFRRALLESSSVDAVGPFKSALVGELGRLGYYVNELAISDVLLHIAIATERVAAGRALSDGPGEITEPVSLISGALAVLVAEHFGVSLGAGDLAHLARLVLTRVVAPGGAAAAEAVRREIDPAVEAAVRA